MSPQFHCAHFLHVPAPSAQYIGLLNFNPHGRTVRTITRKNEQFRSHCNCQSAIGCNPSSAQSVTVTPVRINWWCEVGDDVGGWLYKVVMMWSGYGQAVLMMRADDAVHAPLHGVTLAFDALFDMFLHLPIYTGTPGINHLNHLCFTHASATLCLFPKKKDIQ